MGVGVYLIEVKHWFPRVTICPVNNLPDLIYVTIGFQFNEVNSENFPELYSIRRRIAKIVPHGTKGFMEKIAQKLFTEFQGEFLMHVTVRLAFGRHQVTLVA